MGVSKNTGTPKWMVKIMEHPMNKWMIWGGKKPLFLDFHAYKVCAWVKFVASGEVMRESMTVVTYFCLVFLKDFMEIQGYPPNATPPQKKIWP